MLAGIGERWLQMGLCWLLAGLAAIASLGVGLAALYLWMLPTLPPAGALAVIAGILAVLALFAGLLAALPRRPRTPVGAPGMGDVAELVPDLADSIRRAVAADPRGAIMGALAAGYIAESQPGFDTATLARLLGRMPGQAGR